MAKRKELHITYNSWFCNIKDRLPPEGTDAYDKLSDQEVERCIGGVYIDGVYISGWLYWHVNHWTIRIDTLDEYGNDKRIATQPELRDNEWVRHIHVTECARLRKGHVEVGGRQGGKSEFEASYFAWNAILFKNTQNVIICGNDSDLSLIKDKVDFGLRKLWKGINIPRIDKTWKSNQIRLGYKTPDGENEVWSYIT